MKFILVLCKNGSQKNPTQADLSTAKFGFLGRANWTCVLCGSEQKVLRNRPEHTACRTTAIAMDFSAIRSGRSHFFLFLFLVLPKTHKPLSYNSSKFELVLIMWYTLSLLIVQISGVIMSLFFDHSESSSRQNIPTLIKLVSNIRFSF